MVSKEFVRKIKDYGRIFAEIREEMSNIVVGQINIVDALLRAIIANGHALLEGVPGIAKTLMIRTLASVTKCAFKRIQFTPDLLPTDIIGITAYDEKKAKNNYLLGGLYLIALFLIIVDSKHYINNNEEKGYEV